MLRGPQTVGRAARQLRAAAPLRRHLVGGRLSRRAGSARRRRPLVRKLARAPGAREARWAHLLCGEPPAQAEADAPASRHPTDALVTAAGELAAHQGRAGPAAGADGGVARHRGAPRRRLGQPAQRQLNAIRGPDAQEAGPRDGDPHPLGRHGRDGPRQQHGLLPLHGDLRIDWCRSIGCMPDPIEAGAGDRQRVLQLPPAAALPRRRR